MSLYSTGMVNMVNSSAAVVGVGTAFVANVTAGDGFLIQGETVYYTVLSVTNDTSLTLSVPYAGVTGNGKTYQISRDWTANLGLAEIQPGDPNWPYLLTQKVIRKIDGSIATGAMVTNTPAGNIAATNVQAAINELDTEKAPKESPAFTTQISTPKLDVAGEIYLSASTASEPSYGMRVVAGIGTSLVSSYKMEFKTGTTPTQRILIDENGNVGIGTANPGTSKLKVEGELQAKWIHSTAAGDNTFAGNIGVGMTPAVQFELSGSVGQKASGTTWSNPSDERLKDIQGPADLQRCYDDTKALELKRYRVKDECFSAEQVKDRTVTGLVAGDVQKIIPKAVNVVPFSKVPVLEGEEEYQEEIKNEDGAVEIITKTRPKYRTEVIEDCLNLDMSQVYMQMIGAVQLLIQKVEALEAQVAKA